MNESDAHRTLVAFLEAEIAAFPWPLPPLIYADLDGRAIPELLEGSRPDVYASHIGRQLVILGEAKTEDDIDTPRSHQQYAAYLMHLSHFERGELWIAVPWTCAGTALRACAAVRRRTGLDHIPVRVCAWLWGRQAIMKAWYA